jgi:REP element-mobilizing transposase RayT
VAPSKRFTRSYRSTRETYDGEHRFEHWYLDNQVYFITARCRDQFAAFSTPQAMGIFWDRFNHYCKEYGFTPWVTSLMNNHYHTLGYLRVGENLKHLMQRLHGSVAKLVNDLLPERRADFWRDQKGEEYFDGCIRDEKQCRRAYRYTLTQAQRHRIMKDYARYPNTHVNVELEVGVRRAIELQAFMEGVGYKRYEK